MNQNTEKILLIMKSRGLGMGEIIKSMVCTQNYNIQVEVMAESGVITQSIVRKAERKLVNNNFDQVYITVGINNTTV